MPSKEHVFYWVDYINQWIASYWFIWNHVYGILSRNIIWYDKKSRLDPSTLRIWLFIFYSYWSKFSLISCFCNIFTFNSRCHVSVTTSLEMWFAFWSLRRNPNLRNKYNRMSKNSEFPMNHEVSAFHDGTIR